MSELYEKILQETVKVDSKFDGIDDDALLKYSIHFNVPVFHPRHRTLQAYTLQVGAVSAETFAGKPLVFIDKGLSQSFLKGILPNQGVYFEEAHEETFKEWNWLKNFLTKNHIRELDTNRIIGIGGGLTLNVAAYIAELMQIPLVQIPTTVIGIADGSGGKVRLNMVDKGRFYKHFYKSFYEPDSIIVDPRFLQSLSERHISTGLGEIVKHAVFQSPALLHYLLSPNFAPYSNRISLLKAVLWTASLKAVCLEVDVEENANGSRSILRGGHEFSDRIEEDSHFRIPHGYAVAIGVRRDLEMTSHPLLPKFLSLCGKYHIPTTVKEISE